MERFPGQRGQDDEGNHGDTTQPEVLGRDLSPGAAAPNGRPVADDAVTQGGSGMMLAAVAAVLSGMALLVAGMVVLREQVAVPAWPLVLAVVTVAVTAVVLFGWWRRGSADSANPRI